MLKTLASIQKRGTKIKTQLMAAAILAAISTSANAATVTVCSDDGNECYMKKNIQTAGSFENPVVDNYPDNYRPGYLHAGLYCAGGNWHRGWLQPWERGPVIKRSCGRVD
jgi:hypothetical protein